MPLRGTARRRPCSTSALIRCFWNVPPVGTKAAEFASEVVFAPMSHRPPFPGRACIHILRDRRKPLTSLAMQIWEKPVGGCPPYLPGLQHCHIGSLNVVRGMWERLGLSIDWSLAIHPYGNPTKVNIVDSPCTCLTLVLYKRASPSSTWSFPWACLHE